MNIDSYRLKFQRIHKARVDKSWSWDEHVNDENELTLVHRGVFRGTVDGQAYSAGASDLYFVQPGQKHWEEVGSDHLDYIVLRFQLFDERGESKGFLPTRSEKPPCVRGIQFKLNPVLDRILFLMWQDQQPEEAINPLIHKVIQTVTNFYEDKQPQRWRRQGQTGQRQKIKPALALIDNNVRKSFAIRDLADACRISPNHFSHLFREVMGVSPLRYAHQVRVNHAKKMLENESLCVYEVAEKLGFEDPFYFSRLFKKITGLSPQEYRHHQREMLS